MLIAAVLGILSPLLAEPFELSEKQLGAGIHHTRHDELMGRDAVGYGKQVLQGIDKVQATAMDGGGYFVGVKAVPLEAPVGYPVKLFGDQLFTPARTTSYCSGSSYAAFVEAMNLIFPPEKWKDLTPERREALRMEEPGAKRREDGVKAWGLWNCDGSGVHYSLVQFLGMGTRIPPNEARPGDFMTITWKTGLGHSTVFLGWFKKEGKRMMAVWSSQKGTNGFGDYLFPVERVKSVVAVRLVKPEAIFSFDPTAVIPRGIKEDPLDFLETSGQ